MVSPLAASPLDVRAAAPLHVQKCVWGLMCATKLVAAFPLGLHAAVPLSLTLKHAHDTMPTSQKHDLIIKILYNAHVPLDKSMSGRCPVLAGPSHIVVFSFT